MQSVYLAKLWVPQTLLTIKCMKKDDDYDYNHLTIKKK